MNSKGFFAYPNHKRTSDTISAFCDKVNGAGLGTIETWEQMLIGGKILITEICKKIDDCDFLCADITRLNPNVLFEIGYGIAKKKRIWLIRDTTIPSENSDFKQFKIDGFNKPPYLFFLIFLGVPLPYFFVDKPSAVFYSAGAYSRLFVWFFILFYILF